MKRVLNVETYNKITNYLADSLKIYIYDCWFKPSKFLKEFDSAENIKSVFLFLMTKKPEMVGRFAKKFFSREIRQMQEQNDFLGIENMYFNNYEGKIICVAKTADADRVVFKHKADNYYNIAKAEIEFLKKYLLEVFNPLYGYFLTEDGYITDKNLDKNGKYRVIAEKQGDRFVSKNANFENTNFILIH